MKKSINKNDPKLCSMSCDSVSNEPNLKEDWHNVLLLLLLYMMQGVPYGTSTAIPIILQSRKLVSYGDLVNKLKFTT